MESWALAALWLGILTAISPCPLAANLAAIGFLGKEAGPWTVLAGGVLYAIGRSLAYLGLALILSLGLMQAPGLSRWLQGVLAPLLGPLLVLTGAILLGWIPLPAFGTQADPQTWQRRRKRWGTLAALPLGCVLALAFCPVSAALFFGSLLPLAIETKTLLPATLLYGIGTALPVVGFVGLMAFGIHSLQGAFSLASRVERWLRPTTAIFLILLGLILLWTRIWAPFLGLI